MKRLLILLAATALGTPALAQHQGHTMPMPAPKTKAKPAAKPAPRKPAAKPAPRKPAAKAPARPARKATPKPAARKPAPKPAADPHAGHVMPAAPAKQAADPHAGHQPTPVPPATPPAPDPHAGHQMPPAQAADPHAGHQMPATPAADPHAGHDMGAMSQPAPAPPVAPPSPAALSGPAHAADTVFGPHAMANARETLRAEHGAITTHKLMLDQLELRVRNGRDGYKWDGDAWYGGDIGKLWLKSEGEGSFGESPESAEVQALWSHAIDPWFNLQAGARYDFGPDPERGYLVLGVQGLAPYWFEVDAAAFVSDQGDVRARFEAEYDQRIARKLILQPRAEFDLALQDVPEIGVGSGLSKAELGVRLRYEFVPEFAPYVGVEYERAFGDTADLRRAEGEKAGGWNFLVGTRIWF